MVKVPKNKIITVGMVSICIILLLWHIKQEDQILSCDFRGLVQSVQYDKDGTPKVTINNHIYYLDCGYAFDRKIHNGDYLIKRRGSTIYRLIRYHTPKVYTFDEN
jgi:hypothetical protein